MVHLYSLSLQRPTAISHSVYGSFSAPKANEFVVVRGGKVLELLRPDESGRMKVVYSTEIFGVIRSITAFRVIGNARDFLMIGSDSGRLVAVEFDITRSCFQKVLQETFGRSGCRRVVPGQYVAVDPKGRATIVAAVEKQKLVYNLNKDENQRLSFSSPIEAHRSNTVVHDMIALDVGFDAPEFACLEVNHEALDSGASNEAEKVVSFYAVDVQLNHVVKKKSIVVPFSAHRLISISDSNLPAGSLLVCCEDFLLLLNGRNNQEVTCAFPRRAETPGDRTLMVSAHATHRLKNNTSLIFVQTDSGDLYSVDVHPNRMSISYFDSLPVASSIAISRQGQLFTACENGDAYLFRLLSLSQPDAPTLDSNHPDGPRALLPFFPTKLRSLEVVETLPSIAPMTEMLVDNLLDDDTSKGSQIIVGGGCGRRAFLKSLSHGRAIEEIAADALPGVASGVWTLKAKQDDESDKYIVVSFKDSTLVLEVGESIEECEQTPLVTHTKTLDCKLLADGSIIQIHPSGWRHIPRAGHASLAPRDWRSPPQRPVVAASCNPSQVLLGLGGGVLVLFELDPATSQLVEVHQRDASTDITCLALQPPAANDRLGHFAAVGLSDNTVRIFHASGPKALRMAGAQSLPPDSAADSVAFMRVTTSTLAYNHDSIANRSAVVRGDDEMMTGEDTQDNTSAETVQSRLARAGTTIQSTTWYLSVGCVNGILIRSTFDPVLGTVSNVRSRFLGGAAVRLQPIVTSDNMSALVALTAKPWLICQTSRWSSAVEVIPLAVDHPLEWVATLKSDFSGSALVGTGRGMLRIIAVEEKRSDGVFVEKKMKLSYTPRAIHVLPSSVKLRNPFEETEQSAEEENANKDTDMENPSTSSNAATNNPKSGCMQLLAVIEADHGAYSLPIQRELRDALRTISLPNGVPPNPDAVAAPAVPSSAPSHVKAEEDHADGSSEAVPTRGVDGVFDDDLGFRGSLVAGESNWGSCIRLVNPAAIGHPTCDPTVSLVELEENVAALCCAPVVFEGFVSAPLLVVGCATGLNLRTREADLSVSPSCELRVYGIGISNASGQPMPSLQLLHSTPIESPPTCMTSFHGRLVVGLGSGRCIRMYSLGQKKLLRKCDFRQIPEGPAWLAASPGSDPRLFVGDIRESILVLKYLPESNQFMTIAEDCMTRYSTTGAPLDTLSCVGADKFGNVFLSRVPADAVAAAGQQQALAAAGRRDASSSANVPGAANSNSLNIDGLNLIGKAPKLETQASFFLGDVVTRLRKVKLSAGGAETILASTISGGLSTLTPLSSKEDIETLKQLELLLRHLAFESVAGGSSIAAPLCGRDQGAYRAYFGPIQNVIDGDFCELFERLPAQQQQSIAAQLEKTPQELSKKLEDLRTKVL
eukprot:GDKJ01003288.1.p1 GENE.GDKJ01003288.1~~GDKJ01003288.1.p1  ORF type:complete len:1384 (+),score=369.78 GDKJ01003288.1:37-4188(+)